jgi:hypothetical protein
MELAQRGNHQDRGRIEEAGHQRGRLAPTTTDRVDQARDELAGLLREHRNADAETFSLHSGRRQIDLPLAP